MKGTLVIRGLAGSLLIGEEDAVPERRGKTNRPLFNRKEDGSRRPPPPRGAPRGRR